MKRLCAICCLTIGSCGQLFSANCNVGGSTIFYSNGLNNDYVRAFHAGTELEILVKDRVSSDLAINPSCLGYGLAWNSQVITTSRPWLNNFINFLIQGGVIADIQLAAIYLDQLWADIFAGAQAPPMAQQALGIVLQNALGAFQPDLQRQVSQYQFELTQGNKLIVVAHSQGNLYVNQAYTLVFPPPPPLASMFDVVAVATPANASTVPAGGPYVTLSRDWINAVPGTSLANADNGPCGSPLACHSFENSYLPGSVSGPLILDAVVNAIPIPLTVTVDGAGAGSVSSAPAGIAACDHNSSPCSAAFALNTSAVIDLTATELAGSGFSKWSGSCTQAATISGHDISFPLSLTSPQSCTATFDFLLSVAKAGNGTGTVSSVPTGINCGTGCSAQNAPFSATTPVQLTAAAAPGSIFAMWGGDCATAGTNTTAQVTVSSAMSCIATFSLGGQLTITKSGTGVGTVTSVPAGINCGSTCTTQNAPFPASPPVQLTAAAASGSSFTSWGGDCASAGTNTTAQVTLTSDKSCTATFGSSNPAVRLNPFGSQTNDGPYNVEVVDQKLMLTPAPQDITVTLLREVISQCSGLLFSSNRTVVVSQGQTSASYNFNAGRDPACNTLPITTRYTVTQAVLGSNTVLDLSGIPAQQLILSVTR